ncbi:thioredoxin domain-containing protein [Sporolactobacillus sp. KGMB 08714]|uniref:thioredoxin domain-containing protein n=1 Tax=Sporolactobacillus sp. KGMB 08714 TaxID=3064704 RepID=UPI002FBDAB54
MARESFEDEETAGLLNQYYVSIKVDREERPDIDAVYMKVCQALSGQGGWPLNVFLTPDRNPFYAGTYFPKTSVYGHPCFKDVLLSLKKQYDDNPSEIESLADRIVRTLSEESRRNVSLPEDVLDEVFNHLLQNFDPQYGGFGAAPKFPAPHQLLFLLRYARWRKNGRAVGMVRKTLVSIARGGIHDHIGGGFSRYATDRKWLVPHFEKMLYDQAMLAIAYTEAYQATADPLFERVIDDIFEYCGRELRSPSGGFYCAEDADSEGIEGKYYVWSREEVCEILGKEQARLFCTAYHIAREGNFNGKNIPNLIGTDPADLAQRFSVGAAELADRLHEAGKKLLEARNGRVHPRKDDKILTSWNGLMITALAKAGFVLHKKDYVNLAESAWQFVEKHLIQNGRLMARFRDGETRYDAYLDDYAFLSLACEALYEATFHPIYLKEMKHLADEMIARFWDEAGGGFRLCAARDKQLVLKTKDAYDHAIPSGNSAAAFVLLRLAQRTGESGYARYAEKVFSAFAEDIRTYPPGYTFMLTALLFRASIPKELIVLKGGKGDSFNDAIRRLQSLFLPEVTLFAGDEDTLGKLNPHLNVYSAIGGRTTYFLCEDFICHLPVVHLGQLLRQLGETDS